MADVSNLEECEQEAPVPMYTRCLALADFEGQFPHDLSFKKGETITVLEPCNVIFWYLGENAGGKRGVIPINFFQVSEQRPPPNLPPKLDRRPALPPKPPVAPALPQRMPQRMPKATRSAPDSTHWSKTLPNRPRPPAPPPSSSESDLPSSIDTRPPMPVPRNSSAGKSRSCEALHRAPPDGAKSMAPKLSKYPTAAEFRESSGWFKPTLEKVLMDKLQLNLQAFTQLTGGTYFFQHKWELGLKYAMYSHDVHAELIQLFQNLYEKPPETLNPLEAVIRYHQPDASVWSIRTWRVNNPEELGVEMTKLVIQHRTLQPCGLNTSVKFSSQKEWESFCVQYSKQRQS